MSVVTSWSARSQSLRLAAIGGLTFTVLYAIHRLLRGTGPAGSTTQAVAAYNVEHRGTLLASEVAVGLALLAFIGFLAPLVTLIWQAGQSTPAIAVLIAGGVFLAMGFLSNAEETALVGVADTNEAAAVVALNHLKGRTPIVWTVTALAATISLAILRTNLLSRWLGITGLAAAAMFLLGSIFSVVGRTPGEQSSLIGIGIFIVWMLILSGALLRAGSGNPTPGQA